MKMKAKKMVYTLSSVVLAVVVFLFSILLQGIQTTNGSIPQSPSETPSQSQNDSSGAGLGGGGGETDGGGGGETGGGGGEPILFTVLTDKTQRMYLRQDSKGDYTGKGEHGFVGDTKYYLENPTDINPLYYFGLTQQNSNKQAHQAEIELLKITNDLIPYAPIDKRDSGSGSTYTVTYYPYDYFSDGVFNLLPMGQNAQYTRQEQVYYEFVQKTYLSIEEPLKQTLLDLAQQNNLDPSSATIVADVAYYIQNAAWYDYAYAETNYPDDKDMVTYFLTEHKRGVCRHFAAAATMMFRALGIPARYTIGFAVDVEANVKLEYVGDGHAWTEIYMQGYGWIPVEVTGSTMY